MNLKNSQFLCALALLVALAATSSALAGTLTYATKDKAGKYGVANYYGDIKSWNFSGGVKVEVKDGDKKKVQSIARHLVINATLSDSADYASSSALKAAVESQSLKDFQAVASDGKATDIQKEFAAWRIANLKATNTSTTKSAMQGYLSAYPKGNYARNALMRISYTLRGGAYVKALEAVIALGDARSKAMGNLALGKMYFESNKTAEAKAAFQAAAASGLKSNFPGAITESKSFLGRLNSGATAIKLFTESLAVESTNWQDLRAREQARGNAFMGRGKAQAKANNHASAYKDYIAASFWLGAYGAIEGECVLGAYQSAMAASKAGKDAKKWTARATTLKAFLTENYPKLLK